MPSPETQQVLISIKEASRIMGETPKSMYAMIWRRVLPPGVLVRIGRKVKIHRERLFDWMNAGGQALPGGWKRKPSAPTEAPRADEADQTDPLSV